MRGTPPLSSESYKFRARLLDAFDRSTPIERFRYIDKDTAIVVCPICDAGLTIRFLGTAPRADLLCHNECAETDIAAALRKALR